MFIGYLVKTTNSSDLIDSYLARTLFPLLFGVAPCIAWIKLFSLVFLSCFIFLLNYTCFISTEKKGCVLYTVRDSNSYFLRILNRIKSASYTRMQLIHGKIQYLCLTALVPSSFSFFFQLLKLPRTPSAVEILRDYLKHCEMGESSDNQGLTPSGKSFKYVKFQLIGLDT